MFFSQFNTQVLKIFIVFRVVLSGLTFAMLRTKKFFLRRSNLYKALTTKAAKTGKKFATFAFTAYRFAINLPILIFADIQLYLA